MHRSLRRLVVAIVLLFPATQASAVSFGAYGEWSTGSQSFDFIDGIADSLNKRPGATHDWHTPLEVFARTLASSHKLSSSVH